MQVKKYFLAVHKIVVATFCFIIIKKKFNLKISILLLKFFDFCFFFDGITNDSLF